MKINIVCVGKIKEKFFLEALGEYQKRLQRFCVLKIIEVDEAVNQSNLLLKNQKEGEALLAKCSGVVVALDGGGEMMTSQQIASFVSNKKLAGNSEFSFVIGGSNGLSSEVLKSADLVLSFGKITFPHQLFRVVLAEQVYRALTIIEGLPYHK